MGAFAFDFEIDPSDVEHDKWDAGDEIKPPPPLQWLDMSN